MNTQNFTFILPVHNGGDYLRQCISSILAQTYNNFDVAILENGSNDGTAEWLQTIKDNQIKVYPSEDLLPIGENWRRSLQIPKQEFITFICHDDLLDPNFLEVIRSLIIQHPNATLYQTQFRIIDKHNQLMRPCTPQPTYENAAQYLSTRFTQERDSYATGYVMRDVDYERVQGIPNFTKLLFSDDALWILLMQLGQKVAATQECWSYRSHSASVSGSARWRPHIQGMSQFVGFLNVLKEKDPTIKQEFEKNGPAYFFRFCQHMYLLALIDATRENRVLRDEEKQEIATALALVSPELTTEVFSAFPLRKIINQNIMARNAYRIYLWCRYGKKR